MRTKLILLLLLTAFSLSAQSVKVKELEKKRKQTLTEIENTNKLLSENKRSTKNALTRLSLLNEQIQARKSVIALLNEEINELDKEIQSKEIEIQRLEIELQKKKDNYALSIQKLYAQKNSQNKLLFVLSAQDFTQSFRRVLYLREYSNWRQIQAKEIVEKQTVVNKEKEILQVSLNEKTTLLETRKTEEYQLSLEEEIMRNEIENLQKDEKNLQAELNQKKKQANALNKQIEKIIAEEIAAAERAAKAAEKAKKPKETRKAAEKGGYAMTKEEKTLSSSFANNKGKLPFPLKGNYRIVGRFGVANYEGLKNIEYTSNGIEIETTPNNKAKAVFDGVVSQIFVLPGYQNSIIIRHGNYLTLYACLEEVYVKKGDQVKTGQDIGKIFTDKENGNSTILHFELWKEKNKLNPELWLNK